MTIHDFFKLIETKYKDDEYRQVLMTLYSHLDDKMFPLLVKAEKENKKLAIIEHDTIALIDEYSLDDIIIE